MAGGSRPGAGPRSRRGVGGIISGVLLMAVLLTSVLVYFTTIANNEKARTGYELQALQASGEKGTENFVVSSLDLSGGNVNVYVNNTGPIPMVVSNWLLYCTSGPLCLNPAVPVTASLPLSLTVNSGETSANQLVGPIVSGNTYRIEVISERGNVMSAVWPTNSAPALNLEQITQITNITQNIVNQQVGSVLSGGIAITPDIYLIIPGPFGDSNQQGLWGAVVVNPTDSVMKVSRVTITQYTAQHTSSTEMIAVPCSTTGVSPAVALEWSCPHDNQIQWKDLLNPEVIQPGEVKSFLVRVQPGGLAAGQEEPAAAVIATVFTDTGSYAKAGYSAGMTALAQPLGNVYLTDTTTQSTALQNTHMFGHINDIAPGTTQTFHVAFADLDTNSTSFIAAGSRLIINIPGEFEDVVITSSYLFNAPTIQQRADGFTQIIATTVGNTGDAGAGEAKIIRFTATTPSPEESTTYLMYIFNEGLTNTPVPFSAGALAEVALQVDGTT